MNLDVKTRDTLSKEVCPEYVCVTLNYFFLHVHSCRHKTKGRKRRAYKKKNKRCEECND